MYNNLGKRTEIQASNKIFRKNFILRLYFWLFAKTRIIMQNQGDFYE